MKKIIVLLVFLFSCPAWGQVYPTIKIEQVNINPAYYVGLIVRFNNVEIQPNPGLFDAPKYLDSYVNKIYDYWLWSENKVSLSAGPNMYGYGVEVYTLQPLAAAIVNADLALDKYFKANITCQVEKAVGKSSYARPEPYYLCRTLAIDITGATGNIISLTDGVALPADPIQTAILNERARWDADGDNKIGIAEAIRALQITSGARIP
ncbi:MAG: hypothetical protein ACOYOS_14080 [Syntrophales bacterium]